MILQGKENFSAQTCSDVLSVLQSLIPDIKVNPDAVVELHPEELQLSGDEENADSNRSGQDKGLKIQRTVTQVRKVMSVLLTFVPIMERLQRKTKLK